MSVYFEGGTKISPDLLIGADGINSIIRNELIGDGKPRYLRSMSWRAVIKCQQALLKPGQLYGGEDVNI